MLLVYISATTIRMIDRVMCGIMTRGFTLSILIRVDKVDMCGSGG
jgi:hypothetical protein